MSALHQHNEVTQTQLKYEWSEWRTRQMKLELKREKLNALKQRLEPLAQLEPQSAKQRLLKKMLERLEQQERHLKNVRRQLEHRQREHEKCVRELEHLQALEELGRTPCHCCHSPHCRNRDNNHREREKREQREREQRESKYGNTFCAACGIPFFSATYFYKSLHKTCEPPTPRKCPECREHCRATMKPACARLTAHKYGNSFCESCGVPYFSGSREKTTACVNCR